MTTIFLLDLWNVVTLWYSYFHFILNPCSNVINISRYHCLVFTKSEEYFSCLNNWNHFNVVGIEQDIICTKLYQLINSFKKRVKINYKWHLIIHICTYIFLIYKIKEIRVFSLFVSFLLNIFIVACIPDWL